MCVINVLNVMSVYQYMDVTFEGSKTYVDEKIEEALSHNEEKYTQREATYQLKITRLEEQNRGLADQVQKQQKTLESIPPELKGTAAEITLYEDLHKAFPHDDLDKKIVGIEMPDVVQTIVTESGERIPTPILWDMKTGEDIKPKDIEKAKIYKKIQH
jgi:predicted RNase H-like nuclease (RuvC/YqgF family)